MDNSLCTPEILEAFGLPPQSDVSPLYGGHINDTFVAQSTAGGPRYTLQRINRFVFPSPEDITENMTGVTSFLREKIAARGGDPDRETLSVRPAVDGKFLYIDKAGNPWRCLGYIENATSHETPETLAMLEEAGRAFGDFQCLLSGYPAHTLHEIIPNFHNTPARFAQLLEAVKNDKAGRAGEVGPELEFVYKREKACALLTDLLEKEELPLRVTHNDTKMSNILLDDVTGKAVCVIDLDTVMPGLCAFDFGDSIRAGAATAAEDETDLSKVKFDLERYQAYARGFLSAAGDILTKRELETLPDGAILMTLEVGLRFLADYLNGDVYFRTARPSHNLDRARNQFRLVEEMEAAREEMGRVIQEMMR